MIRLLLDIIGGLLSYVLVGIFLISVIYGGLYFLQFGVIFSVVFLVLLGGVAAIALHLIRRFADREDDG